MNWNIKKITTDQVIDVEECTSKEKPTVCLSLYLTWEKHMLSTLHKDWPLEQTVIANASVNPLWQYTSLENGLKGYFAAVSYINKCL